MWTILSPFFTSSWLYLTGKNKNMSGTEEKIKCRGKITLKGKEPKKKRRREKIVSEEKLFFFFFRLLVIFLCLVFTACYMDREIRRKKYGGWVYLFCIHCTTLLLHFFHPSHSYMREGILMPGQLYFLLVLSFSFFWFGGMLHFISEKREVYGKKVK